MILDRSKAMFVPFWRKGRRSMQRAFQSWRGRVGRMSLRASRVEMLVKGRVNGMLVKGCAGLKA